MKFKTPKLTVVGAGPGDIDLITVKAIKVLKTADVVFAKSICQIKWLQQIENISKPVIHCNT